MGKRPKPLPCWWCGFEGVCESADDYGDRHISCGRCGCAGPAVRTKIGAVITWNIGPKTAAQSGGGQ